MEEDEGVIRCICAYDEDDGFTIQCEKCLVWQHAACVGIRKDRVPDEYFCEECDPRPLDVQMAKEIQRRKRMKKKQKSSQKPSITTNNGTGIASQPKPSAGADGKNDIPKGSPRRKKEKSGPPSRLRSTSKDPQSDTASNRGGNTGSAVSNQAHSESDDSDDDFFDLAEDYIPIGKCIIQDDRVRQFLASMQPKAAISVVMTEKNELVENADQPMELSTGQQNDQIFQSKESNESNESDAEFSVRRVGEEILPDVHDSVEEHGQVQIGNEKAEPERNEDNEMQARLMDRKDKSAEQTTNVLKLEQDIRINSGEERSDGNRTEQEYENPSNDQLYAFTNPDIVQLKLEDIVNSNLRTTIQPVIESRSSVKTGLFADTFIPSESFVLEFRGQILLKDEESRQLSFERFVYAHPVLDLVVDARRFGNEARFIRYSCQSNTHLRSYVTDDNGDTVVHLGVFSSRIINSGEEITLPFSADDQSILDGKIALDCACVDYYSCFFNPNRMENSKSLEESVASGEEARPENGVTAPESVREKDEKSTEKDLRTSSVEEHITSEEQAIFESDLFSKPDKLLSREERKLRDELARFAKMERENATRRRRGGNAPLLSHQKSSKPPNQRRREMMDLESSFDETDSEDDNQANGEEQIDSPTFENESLETHAPPPMFMKKMWLKMYEASVSETNSDKDEGEHLKGASSEQRSDKENDPMQLDPAKSILEKAVSNEMLMEPPSSDPASVQDTLIGKKRNAPDEGVEPEAQTTRISLKDYKKKRKVQSGGPNELSQEGAPSEATKSPTEDSVAIDFFPVKVGTSTLPVDEGRGLGSATTLLSAVPAEPLLVLEAIPDQSAVKSMESTKPNLIGTISSSRNPSPSKTPRSPIKRDETDRNFVSQERRYYGNGGNPPQSQGQDYRKRERYTTPSPAQYPPASGYSSSYNGREYVNGSNSTIAKDFTSRSREYGNRQNDYSIDSGISRGTDNRSIGGAQNTYHDKRRYDQREQYQDYGPPPSGKEIRRDSTGSNNSRSAGYYGGTGNYNTGQGGYSQSSYRGGRGGSGRY